MFVLKFIFIYFERQLDSKQGRGRERDRERESQADFVVSIEPDVGLDPKDCEIVT